MIRVTRNFGALFFVVLPPRLHKQSAARQEHFRFSRYCCCEAGFGGVGRSSLGTLGIFNPLVHVQGFRIYASETFEGCRVNFRMLVRD